MLKIIFLGTAGSFPTPRRSPSCIFVNREGDLFLFDCGEGAQRQMMIAKCGIMRISSIFITHFHADHILGIPGLIQTLSFNGREEPLTVYGPVGVEEFVELFISLGRVRLGFDLLPVEVSGGDTIAREGYSVSVFNTVHGVPSVGYALVEDERPGRFDRERAVSLGVPPGPLFRRLHRGESVEIDGRIVTSEEVVGKPRRGRKIVYTGDTRPTEETIKAALGADLLIHDASMADDLSDWARQTGHSTAGEAARVASEAGVGQLVLTHVSARYSENTDVLLDDARRIFGNTLVAYDLMELTVPYPE
ncbi:Ribonuclease Z [Candidatus Methanoperedenaceae archaeon GB50]|nr:Ribonuclease Z [Candidatus Methanoperedenaceae archaeon GB50]CAD7772369.1 MAG: Ribonuclease Z [Candidatus Methanoperedenaceae archaeon GB50]